MTMNPLPPQAYTKDTLLKAYAWLQNQPGNIKELASTPDILVSLFLKAQRNGESSLQTPSIQNFKNELRSLAGIMGEFENHSVPAAETRHQSPPQQKIAPPPAEVFQPQRSEVVSKPVLNYDQSPVSAPKLEGPQAAPEPLPAPAMSSVKSLLGSLDSESLEMIHEVRKALNLSSEGEALRAVIKLGCLKVRAITSS